MRYRSATVAGSNGLSLHPEPLEEQIEGDRTTLFVRGKHLSRCIFCQISIIHFSSRRHFLTCKYHIIIFDMRSILRMPVATNLSPAYAELSRLFEQRIAIIEGPKGIRGPGAAALGSRFPRPSVSAATRTTSRATTTILCLTQPGLIEEFHRTYRVEAGADLFRPTRSTARRNPQSDFQIESHAAAIQPAPQRRFAPAARWGETQFGPPHLRRGCAGTDQSYVVALP